MGFKVLAPSLRKGRLGTEVPEGGCTWKLLE